jgi:endonuclease YncB( thermonuclease family)
MKHRLLAPFLLAVAIGSPALSQTIAGTASVIDGDTIEIHGLRVRLHGIDSPEGRQECTLAGKPWRCGPAAANALSDLIGRRPVTCQQTDTDRYGRAVARCEVAGEDIGRWMVRQGWAMAYAQYSKDYVRDQKAAKSAKAGLWAGDFMPPWEWRKSRRTN